MASDSEEEQPRRSTRARKSVVKFSVPQAESKRSSKKKPAEKETIEKAMELSGEESVSESEGSEDDFTASRRTRAAMERERESIGKAGRGRKRKARARGSDEEDHSEDEAAAATGPRPGKEYTIATDNDLFEAVRHGDSALELTADDWVNDYQRGKDEAAKGIPLAELVNFCIRCCGCSESVDNDEVVDHDGATDKMEEIQDTFKKVAQAAYPLIAKSKQLRKFRNSLSEFISRLVQHAHTSSILYDDLFCSTLQAWLVAATSSRLRSFRHTSTVIVLEFISGLCQVAKVVEKDFSKATRQHETEEKKSRRDKQRLKQFKDNVDQLHKQKMDIESYISELLSSVFVHRYRDAEPSIRLECIRALGEWMITHRTYFLQGSHLRYIGWVLTDSHKEVRLEAFKALNTLYSEPENIGMLQLFTERFKTRFIEMAACEPELSVRRTAVSVLESIDRHGLLEEDQQAQLAGLIFHVDVKVRHIIAPYFISRVNEESKEVLESGANPDSAEQIDKRIWLKCFAQLLVRQAQRLDAEVEKDGVDFGESQLATTATLHDLALTGSSQGRFGAAVEAVWGVDEGLAVKDWEALANYILLDHSGNASNKEQQELDEHQLLEEAQEGALVEVLVAAISCIKSKADIESRKAAHKDDAPNTIGDMTRALIHLLPKLLEKYQTQPERIAQLLKIPYNMNLELYLDMRMVTAYETLWDFATKHFLEETQSLVLDSAFAAIYHLHQCSSLRDTNENKLQNCISSLCTNTRDLTEDIDLASATLSSEQVRLFTAAMHRFHLVFSRFDITSQINDDGAQTFNSVNSLIDCLIDRGRNGTEDENDLVIYAITLLFDRLLWMVKPLSIGDPDTIPNGTDIEVCLSTRDDLAEKLTDLATGDQVDPTESVRSCAFTHILKLVLLMQNLGGSWTGGRARNEALTPLRLICDEERQYRCAGYVEAQLQRLVDIKADVSDREKIQSSPGIQQPKSKSREQLSEEHSIRTILGAYVATILGEAFSTSQACVLLPYFGRIDAFVDECCRKLMEKLKDDGLFNDRGTSVLVNALQHAMNESLDYFIDTEDASEDTLLDLAKLCAAATIVYKGIMVIKKLPSNFFVQLHTGIIDHAIDRVSKLDPDEQAAERAKALQVFKGLVLMLKNLTPHEAQQIQSRLQQALKEKDLEADSEEIWEPLQAYYRRLSNAMAKAEGGKKKTKKTKSSAPTGDDEERLDDNGEEPQPRPPKSALKRRPKPKPKGRPTSSPRRPRSSSQEDQNEGSEMSDADIGDKMTETKTPKRPKHAGDTSSEAPSPQKRSLKRREREPNDAHDESELAESLMTYESQGDTLPSRKRSKQN